MYSHSYKYFFVIGILTFLLLSCKKFVQVEPPITNPTSNSVYQNDATAIAVLSSIYNQMQFNGIAGGTQSISTLTALNSDELKNYSVDLLLSQSYSNALRNSSPVLFWNNLYNFIYISNAAIEGINKSTTLSSAVKQQLLGEAKFLRGFFYFYLVNLYGDVPLLLTTDYRINAKASREDTDKVYEQIINDLKEAEDLLNDNYVGLDAILTTTERIRPNKASASAMLARVYLYTGNWAESENEATKVINNTRYSLVSNLNNVFKKNSTEAIWQIQPVNPQFNTLDAAAYILTSEPGSNNYFALTNNLVSSFDDVDARKSNWIKSFTVGAKTYYYAFKYQVNAAQPSSEYAMVIRLAEVYLIRAEARARQEKVGDAQSDLNAVRARAKLPGTTANTKDLLIVALEKERELELFTEWGHRWFDIKRLGRASAIMSVITPQKGGVWSDNWKLYPIPQSEILLNKNLTQNDGY
ncbi:hypothetical protein A4D02_32870 [Niastella koreensis]|uniref:RagB/SusD domain-containing protein n=2 Tax=Niastella koreensis TaxID=354356 RepID=G8T8P1_NIAKG|nr:RagB/SusD family nutrient uptake outer membrane protein [Niastella koreensis]AEW01221.1 RagB/SusD domain-containing protein [Niastella koreensis GR20-10]OQP45986.1 hypothetical protein A4D02_32870 [Niastella koreensis]